MALFWSGMHQANTVSGMELGTLDLRQEYAPGLMPHGRLLALGLHILPGMNYASVMHGPLTSLATPLTTDSVLVSQIGTTCHSTVERDTFLNRVSRVRGWMEGVDTRGR